VISSILHTRVLIRTALIVALMFTAKSALAEEESATATTGSQESSQSFGESVSETSKEAWNNTKEAASEVEEAVSEGSKKAWNSTKETTQGAGKAVTDASKEAWQNTKTGAKQGWAAAKETATEIMDAATGDADHTPAPVTDRSDKAD
jgi:hypothetical protein